MIIANSLVVLPKHIVRSKDLIQLFALSERDHEIDLSRMAGVHERRYFHDPALLKQDQRQQAVAKLSLQGLRFLSRSQLQNIDMLVHCSTTPAGVSPATAHQVHHLAGLSSSTQCLDIMSSCSSFLSALKLCESLAMGNQQRCLIIASETKSQHIAPHDKVTAAIFADGSSAYYLDPYINDTYNGSFEDKFFWVDPFVDSSLVSNISVQRVGNNYFVRILDGKFMFRKTIQAFIEMISRCLALAKEKKIRLRNVYIHQANANIVAEIRKKFPELRIPCLISDVGNLVSASMPAHRVRCVLLEYLFHYFDLNNNLPALFDRCRALEMLQSDLHNFFMHIHCEKEGGVLFSLNHGPEKISLWDSAATCASDSWLARISDEEWKNFFEDCVQTRSFENTARNCDAWVVAGGGFQALGVLHLRTRNRRLI